MARIRYAAGQKKYVEEEYQTMSRKEKTNFSKRYNEATDLDDIATYKTQNKVCDSSSSGMDKLFKSRDQLLVDSGWRPEISNTPFGERLAAKADNKILWCEKIGGKAAGWIRQHNILTINTIL